MVLLWCAFPLSAEPAPETVTVPLKRISGLPCVRAKINGHALWMVIDTGSAVSVLDTRSARDCVLAMAPVQTGASAAGMLGSEPLSLSAPAAIEIGGWRSDALPWFVRREEPKRPAGWPLFTPMVRFNLLGLDRLQAMCRYVTLDNLAGQVVFGIGQEFRPDRGASSVPFARRGGLPYVDLQIGADRVTCLLDTGSSVALILDPSSAPHLDPRSLHAADGVQFGLGERGSVRSAVWSVTLPEVMLGGITLTKFSTLILARPPALGFSAFNHAAVTIDFEHRQLWIRR